MFFTPLTIVLSCIGCHSREEFFGEVNVSSTSPITF